jgi:Helix-turn-helix domain
MGYALRAQIVSGISPVWSPFSYSDVFTERAGAKVGKCRDVNNTDSRREDPFPSAAGTLVASGGPRSVTARFGVDPGKPFAQKKRDGGWGGRPRSTFYRWCDQYQTGGLETLEDRSPRPDRVCTARVRLWPGERRARYAAPLVWSGHLQHTVRYTELTPHRFKWF